MVVKVQKDDFDIGREVEALLKSCDNPGAVVTFSGLVRSKDKDKALKALELEHYPSMTEKQLNEIEAKARARWNLEACLVIHRFGHLKPKDRIVLVVCISEHREDAFQAASFLMDFLKTSAPFWKKEIYQDGGAWVEAKAADDKKAKSWES